MSIRKHYHISLVPYPTRICCTYKSSSMYNYVFNSFSQATKKLPSFATLQILGTMTKNLGPLQCKEVWKYQSYHSQESGTTSLTLMPISLPLCFHSYPHCHPGTNFLLSLPVNIANSSIPAILMNHVTIS